MISCVLSKPRSASSAARTPFDAALPAWNGFVEGPTWGAWWIQNSYGPTYCAMPFYVEPYLTFLKNAHDLWFDQMGDGKRQGAKEKDWIVIFNIEYIIIYLCINKNLFSCYYFSIISIKNSRSHF